MGDTKPGRCMMVKMGSQIPPMNSKPCANFSPEGNFNFRKNFIPDV